MTIIGNYQNKRMEENRSFPNNFQLWLANGNQLGVWVLCAHNEEKPQCPTENQVLAYEQRLPPLALAHSIVLPICTPNHTSKVLQAPRPPLFLSISYFSCLLAMDQNSICKAFPHSPLPIEVPFLLERLKLTPNQKSSQFSPCESISSSPTSRW